MKYFIIAGESSGDLHGSNLLKQIKKLNPKAQFMGCGGALMQKQSCKLCLSINQMDFMGFAEVIKNLGTIRNNFKIVRKAIQNFNPDVIILIDYPGFNLRLLKQLSRTYKTVYYISPQLWAWKASRIKTIKKYVDKMLVILPFEKAFYNQYNFKTHYVGHPLLDAIDNFKQENKNENNIPQGCIALLPGSRKQEIERMLPIYNKVAQSFKNQQFVIAALAKWDKTYYEQFNLADNISLVFGQTYSVLKNAKAALVTSGTATLETALFKVPQVVCYKTSWLNFFIGKKLVKLKHVSLVNLICDKQVVTELLQDEANTKSVSQALQQLLDNNTYREKMMEDYDDLIQLLGGIGASKRAAIEIQKMLI